MPTLDWLNRAEALISADKIPYRVLEPVSEFFSPLPHTLKGTRAGEGPGERAAHDNLLIQGDNLDALKVLLPFYRGRVRCIFIDPPYNTKSTFEHYDDRSASCERQAVASSGRRCAFRFVYLDDGGLNMEAQLDQAFKG